MEVPGVTQVGAKGRRGAERRLLERWHGNGDREAREQLVRRLLPVAHTAARRYRASGETLDDLTQVASIGVIKAIDRFDLERSTSLRAYAERLVEGELRHHLRDTSLLHLPRALYARGRAVARASTELTARLGRRPTTEEVALELGLPCTEVAEALAALVATELRSLDALGGGDQRLGYAERHGADDPRLELVEQRTILQRVWRTLDPRARACLRLRFAEERTYDEIATQVGISPTHAARLTRQALDRMRAVVLADAT